MMVNVGPLPQGEGLNCLSHRRRHGAFGRRFCISAMAATQDVQRKGIAGRVRETSLAFLSFVTTASEADGNDQTGTIYNPGGNRSWPQIENGNQGSQSAWQSPEKKEFRGCISQAGQRNGRQLLTIAFGRFRHGRGRRPSPGNFRAD